nr:hypothetical protein VITISV_043636 [Ipomoea batatas]
MPTRTANHARVSQADFSLKQSSQSSTPNNKRIDNPSMAATTLEIPRPIRSNFFAAIAGASGVSLVSGGYNLYKINGVAKRATNAGKLAALNQETHGDETTTPSSSASLRQIFTNPRAKKKEITISQITSLVNAPKAAEKGNVLVRTEVVSPRKAQAPTGKGLRTRPAMVERKMASNCHAWGETSGGLGMAKRTRRPIATEIIKGMGFAPWGLGVTWGVAVEILSLAEEARVMSGGGFEMGLQSGLKRKSLEFRRENLGEEMGRRARVVVTGVLEGREMEARDRRRGKERLEKEVAAEVADDGE